MPSGTTVGGRFTRRPGVNVTVNRSANAGRRATPKRLAVVGDFPFLEQNTPTLCTSLRSMLKLSPVDANLKRAAACIYRPGKDSRISASGPSEVYLVNAGESTQASVTLVDSVPNGALTISSKAWGYAGNRTSYALVVDTTVPTAPTYTFTFNRDGVPERFGPIVGRSMFSLAYSGNDSFVTLAGFNSSGEFFVTASKDAIAIGDTLASFAWDGAVSVDPSREPDALETYTVTINGTNKVTGEADTQDLTWTNGGGHAAKSTTKTFSTITSIVFAQAGGTPTTPTFTVSGDMVRVTTEQFPYVKDLTNYLATKSADLTVSAVDSLAGSTLTSDLDIKAATSLGSAVPFRVTMAYILGALAGSALIEAEAVSGGTLPVAASGMLTGGTQSAASDGDWPAALATLNRSKRVRVVSLLASSLAAHQALVAHCDTMWGVGRYECQGWTGTAAQATKDTIKTRAGDLNSDKVSLVPQEAKIIALSGVQERVAPYWYALMHAAAQCSVGVAVPLTKKRLNVVEVYDGPDWSVEDDVEELLGAGLTITTQGELGPEIERALTTHLADDDDGRTAPSAMEGIAQYILRQRALLEATIGDPAVATTGPRIKGLVETDTKLAALDGDGISGWDESQGASVEQEGGRWIVGVAVAPIYEITFVDFTPSILPVSFQV
ncbi:MAG TPA: hypothetical protein DEQ43_09780 [Nocardioides bacterium]|nr:hypothetical protein [Nocardioides sp.]